MKSKNLIAISVIAITMLISTINISSLNQERSSIFSLENVFSKALADIEIPEPELEWIRVTQTCGEFWVNGIKYYHWETDCYPGDEEEECFPEACTG